MNRRSCSVHDVDKRNPNRSCDGLSQFVHGVRAQNNKIDPTMLQTLRRFHQKGRKLLEG